MISELNPNKIRELNPDNSKIIKLAQTTKISCITSQGTYIIKTDEIDYCKSDGNYTHIFYQDKNSILLSKTLKDISNKLPSNLFVRVHQSFLVNIKKVSFLEKNFLLLESGEKIPVSRSSRRQSGEMILKHTIQL